MKTRKYITIDNKETYNPNYRDFQASEPNRWEVVLCEWSQPTLPLEAYRAQVDKVITTVAFATNRHKARLIVRSLRANQELLEKEHYLTRLEKKYHQLRRMLVNN